MRLFYYTLFTIFISMGMCLSPAHSFRLVTYNVKAISDEKGFGPENAKAGEYNALLYILNRLNADIICLQEITGDDDLLAFTTLQTDLLITYGHDYSSTAVSSFSGSFNDYPTSLYNGCLSKFPIVYSKSWSALELCQLNGGSHADDVTRDIFEVHVSVNGSRMGIFIAHIKSGDGYPEAFRRAVEIHRISQAVNHFKNLYPTSPFVIVGDFNEDYDNCTRCGNVYTTAPASLPGSYDLGNDISLPLTYNPFLQLQSLGTAITFAPNEDRPNDTSTHLTLSSLNFNRLDYVFHSNRLQPDNAIVYNACYDNGIDDPPAGEFMDFIGSDFLLTCNQYPQSISTTSSDHFPLIVDFSIVEPQIVPAISPLPGLLLLIILSVVVGKKLARDMGKK